jgi:peptidoglycan hydrolase FlgJ
MHTPASWAEAKPAAPFQQLEAMLVRNLIGSLVPRENFGGQDSGLAGEYWGSMLADELANSLSASGQLGIAKIIQKNFNVENPQSTDQRRSP